MSDVNVIHTRNIKKARKDHACMASVWLRECLGDLSSLTFGELRVIAKARKNGWKIKAGEPYIRQNNIQDGEYYVFKAIPEIHQICLKHKVYE